MKKLLFLLYILSITGLSGSYAFAYTREEVNAYLSEIIAQNSAFDRDLENKTALIQGVDEKPLVLDKQQEQLAREEIEEALNDSPEISSDITRAEPVAQMPKY